jgi:hypothetical protein
MTQHASFVVLRGIVADLRIRATHVNPLADSSEQQLATGVAILQSFAGAPGAVNSAQFAEYEGDPAHRFVMAVDGKTVTGHLWDVGFKDGDEVEVVGRAQGEIIEAAAVAKPSSRLLWVRPHHLRGTRAFVHAERKRIWSFILIMDALMLAATVAVGALGSDSMNWVALLSVVGGALLVANVLALFIQRTPRAIADFSQDVDAIGRALRLPLPELIDLPANNRSAYKQGKPLVRGAYYY